MSARKGSATFRVCVGRDWLSKFSRNPPPPVCRRGCTVSPEKGGALRNQSTRGRRLGVAAVICGALFVAPLLLLQRRYRVTIGDDGGHRARRAHVGRAPCIAPRRCEPAVAPRRVPRAGDDHDDGAAGDDHDDGGTAADDDDDDCPAADHHDDDRTTTAAADHDDDDGATGAAGSTNSEAGEATWYSEAPSGMCASPTLALRDGAHRGQRRDRAHRPSARWTTVRVPATRGWSTCRRRASLRSPTSGREWWTSQSPGDPFRRRHRPAAVGARSPSQQGPRPELRR